MAPKRKSLYPTGRDARVIRAGGRKEIDLRAEFDEIMFGGPNTLPHGRPVLIRRMRSDDEGNLLRCVCRDPLTDEADHSNDCPYCLGEGYYWDEALETTYQTYVGADGGLASRQQSLWPAFIRSDTKIYYFRYDVKIGYSDKIVDLLLDAEGELVVPYKRQSIYRPETIDERRSDFGRLEFLTVYAKEFPSTHRDTI